MKSEEAEIMQQTPSQARKDTRIQNKYLRQAVFVRKIFNDRNQHVSWSKRAGVHGQRLEQPIRNIPKLSSISNVERFYLEVDMKGRERKTFPLSFNIVSHTPHTSIIELNLGYQIGPITCHLLKIIARIV